MTYRIEKDDDYKGLYYGNFLKAYLGDCSFFRIGDLYIALRKVKLKEDDVIELESEKTIVSGRLIKRKKTIKATTAYKFTPLNDIQISNGSFEVYRLVR